MYFKRNGDSVAICVYERFTTLCRLRLGLGLGLGHPSVTHGWPLGDAWVTLGSNGTSALFATKDGKRGVGWARRARLSPTSRVIARDRKSKLSQARACNVSYGYRRRGALESP